MHIEKYCSYDLNNNKKTAVENGLTCYQPDVLQGRIKSCHRLIFHWLKEYEELNLGYIIINFVQFEVEYKSERKKTL